MQRRGGCRRRARMQRRGGRRGGGGDELVAVVEVRKGPWSADEDEVLRQHVREHGPRE
ncbi:hypothetical protein ACP70R_015731 [Stipagrostis hirtigluma subsp. patula]